MTRHHRLRYGALLLMAGSVLLSGWGSQLSGTRESAEPPGLTGLTPLIAQADQPDPDPIQTALDLGRQTATLARRARTAQDWDQVVQGWLEAIAILQAVPPEAPERTFSQRTARKYAEQLATAQDRAHLTSFQGVYPSFGSSIFDEQMAVYQSYVAAMGPPDVLIVGSSRVLQGLDAEALQTALANQGHGDLRVFNFGINGATAQVVNFLLQSVLPADHQPGLIIWGDGSRAFNSGRFDRTFARLLESPGYQLVRNGQRLGADVGSVPRPSISAIDAKGFMPVDDEFDPGTYYQQFPRVSGQFDGDYQPFNLGGIQTNALQAVANYSRSRGIPLVLVNMPLSDEHLDEVRLGYERQFQAFLQQQGQQGGFQVVDLMTQWQGQNRFFADPSHINRQGADAIARQLAGRSDIPWPSAEDSEAD